MTATTTTSFENGVLTVVRTYDAPRERVFDAWIKAAKMERWYGPPSCREVRSTIEPRVGGAYDHVMVMEQGAFESKSVITAFEPPALLEFEGPGAASDAPSTVRVAFTDLGDGRTEVRLVHRGLPEGAEQGVIPAWTGAFEKLAAFLEREAAEA